MKGIVFRGEKQKFKLGKIKTVQSEAFTIPFEKTLFVENVTVPVDLLPAAWHFLERWDMAVPLWRYGKTAADIGTPAERDHTREIIRDLRVLLHSYELLFVRRNEAGLALMAAWEEECSDPGGDKRLAFLRALYRVKPRLCVLPTSWLAEVQQRNSSVPGAARWPAARRQARVARPLVTVELEPGRMVKVHQGDEERVLEQFKRMRGGRRGGH